MESETTDKGYCIYHFSLSGVFEFSYKPQNWPTKQRFFLIRRQGKRKGFSYSLSSSRHILSAHSAWNAFCPFLIVNHLINHQSPEQNILPPWSILRCPLENSTHFVLSLAFGLNILSPLLKIRTQDHLANAYLLFNPHLNITFWEMTFPTVFPSLVGHRFDATETSTSLTHHIEIQ